MIDINELFSKTDWKQFRAQKQLLVKAAEGISITDAEREQVDGMVNFLDAIGDLAHDVYGQQVYPRIIER